MTRPLILLLLIIFTSQYLINDVICGFNGKTRTEVIETVIIEGRNITKNLVLSDTSESDYPLPVKIDITIIDRPFYNFRLVSDSGKEFFKEGPNEILNFSLNYTLSERLQQVSMRYEYEIYDYIKKENDTYVLDIIPRSNMGNLSIDEYTFEIKIPRTIDNFYSLSLGSFTTTPNAIIQETHYTKLVWSFSGLDFGRHITIHYKYEWDDMLALAKLGLPATIIVGAIGWLIAFFQIRYHKKVTKEIASAETNKIVSRVINGLKPFVNGKLNELKDNSSLKEFFDNLYKKFGIETISFTYKTKSEDGNVDWEWSGYFTDVQTEKIKNISGIIRIDRKGIDIHISKFQYGPEIEIQEDKIDEIVKEVEKELKEKYGVLAEELTIRIDKLKRPQKMNDNLDTGMTAYYSHMSRMFTSTFAAFFALYAAFIAISYQERNNLPLIQEIHSLPFVLCVVLFGASVWFLFRGLAFAKALDYFERKYIRIETENPPNWWIKKAFSPHESWIYQSLFYIIQIPLIFLVLYFTAYFVFIGFTELHHLIWFLIVLIIIIIISIKFIRKRYNYMHERLPSPKSLI